MRRPSKFKIGDIIENANDGTGYVYTIPSRCKKYRIIEREVHRYGVRLRVEVVELAPGERTVHVGDTFWCDRELDFKLCRKKRVRTSE
jgi:hypothetical protein